MYAFVSLAPPYSPRKPIPIAFPHLHICFISNLRQLFYFIFPFSFVVLPTICVFRFQSSLAIVHTRELQTKTLYVYVVPIRIFTSYTHSHQHSNLIGLGVCVLWLGIASAKNKICATDKTTCFRFKNTFAHFRKQLVSGKHK